MVEGIYGVEFNTNKLMALGMATLEFELDYTRKTGFKIEEAHLPEFLYEEKSPLANTKFDIPQEQFAIVGIQIDEMNKQNPFAKL